MPHDTHLSYEAGPQSTLPSPRSLTLPEASCFAPHEEPWPGRLSIKPGRQLERSTWRSGGAQVAQQYLAAGLIDELEIHIVPLLLGRCARLFESLEASRIGLEQVSAVEVPA